ncbi:MAG: transglycosylase domain-containing protein [Oscillospiraceae bacterium]|nr:transglycosylase domain-containing protein [Oscillospiraceae bacterium]
MAEQKKNKGAKSTKKKKKRSNPVAKVFTVIGTVILSLFLIAVISVSIIAAALTVYVMQFRENTPIDIDLDSLDLAYTTFIYGYDSEGEEVELASISRAADRIPVSIGNVPKHVQDAFVYAEDVNFYEHAGVNWMRTFGAFLNEITNGLIYGKRQGGSTITQQLVKNVTKDESQTWDRKLREVFRASDLERYRTKEEILEAYLNCIGFGGSTSGIQAASLKYFGKEVSELDLAEAACLAAIPKSPETLNPFADLEANRGRQEYVLGAMLSNAAISEREYEEAMNEELKFRDPSKDPTRNEIQNWYIDMVIRDVTNDLMNLYGVTQSEASDMLYNGGYTIYTPIDIEMQEKIEAKYRDYSTFSDEVLNDPPQSAFIVTDYTGNILAVAGAVGEKAGSNVWNHATMSPRQPGSAMKPLAGYAYCIEHGLTDWSDPQEDSPLEIPDDDNPGETRKWPTNYSSNSADNVWSNRMFYTYEALERSLNTVSARLVDKAGAANVFEFVQNKYQFSTLEARDAYLSPMSVGALTNGVYLRELVAAYQVFGNGGKFFSPTSYTYVLDPSGDMILQHKYTPIQSISEDTAYVMNRMMKEVVEGEHGTGRAAKLPHVEVVGKTGTSQEWRDNLFVACTPDYVSGVWYGYENNRKVEPGTYYGTAELWKRIFGDIADRGETAEFTAPKTVNNYFFCADTGDIASTRCKTYHQGWYTAKDTPELCKHGTKMNDKNYFPGLAEEEEPEDGEHTEDGDEPAHEDNGENEDE